MKARPYIQILALIAIACVVTATTTQVRFVDRAGVKDHLPAKVGPWTGIDYLYCSKPTCGKEYRADELNGRTTCADCDSPLTTASPVETSVLPPDTVIFKKLYEAPGEAPVFTAVVIGGKDRSSIHRPQLCLVAAGNEIEGSRTMAVKLGDGSTAHVMVLDLLIPQPGTRNRVPTYYAYWFVGANRETPHHTVRMFWMAYDRVFRGVSEKWSYVTVSGLRTRDGSHVAAIERFLRDFHPQIVATGKS